MNNLNELNFEILINVSELDELQTVLKQFIFTSDFTPENQIYISEIGDRHLQVCNKLKILLECYFKEEEEAGIPKTLSYRRLYKQLIKV